MPERQKMFENRLIKQSNLIKKIKNGDIPKLFLIFGGESYLVEDTAKKIINTLLPGDQKEFGLEIIHAENIDIKNIISAIKTSSLFGLKRVVWIKDCENLLEKKSKGFDKNIEHSIPDDTYVILTAEKSGKKIGEVIEFTPFKENKKSDRNQLYEFAQLKLKNGNKKLSPTAFEYLLSLTGVNLRQIMNELEKLELYCKDNITEDDINILVPKSIEYAPFAMSDAVAEKNLPRALKLLEEFSRTKNSGYSLLPMLTKRIRLLLQIKILIEKGDIPEDIVKRGYYDQKTYSSASKKLSGQHPYVIFKTAQQSLKFQKEELTEDIKKLFEAEVSIKTGEVPQKLALEMLIAGICKINKNLIHFG